ncbi:hypothetical protein [Myxococcus sp. Y35]|uniref:hypothetical protein n=1 Tax=Pseudomyxococcus flavus TaxID=3115648 RepID=UPI003CEFDBCA
MDIPYFGSGPYCYSNSLAMMLGDDVAPDVGIIETVTGSPFGMQLTGGVLPFFDPYGWNPEIGIEDALAALGWRADTMYGQSASSALDCLASCLARGPVMVGPVEMGYLRHQPGKTGPIGADHYIVVLGIDDGHVTMHDPQGYPYARLPLADFTLAWQADTIDYARPFTMRTNFTQVARVDPATAVRAVIPRALDWLRPDACHNVAPATVGNEDAAMALAARIEAGCDDGLRGHLIHFAIRVGARRLADAARCLQRVGHPAAASILTKQAQLIGSIQHPLVTGHDRAAAMTLRALAPTYQELRAALGGD